MSDGIRYAACRPRSWRSSRRTASIPTCTLERTCWRESRRTSTSRTGGIARNSNAPRASSTRLEFPGINYRAEIWLNGEKIADDKQVAGMYAAHELNVTARIKRDAPNVLAVKVTPEQLIEDVDGVELADSWYDWINWKYLGYKGPKKVNPGAGVSFVPDRNAGIWKPVYLRVTGGVSVNHPLANTELSRQFDRPA